MGEVLDALVAGDRGGATGAALVEQQHAEVLERAVQPRRAARVPGRARGLEARAALQVHEPRPVAAVRVGDLPREDGDRLARRPVVERDVELVLGDEQAGDHADSTKAKNCCDQRSRASSGGKWPDSS